MKTVLIVDDHASFRRVARLVLEAGGLRVIGEAADAASAVCAVRDLNPQVILLDIGLPDGDGITLAEHFAGVADPPDVVLTSSRDAGEFGPRLRSACARGFVAKDALSGPAILTLLGPNT